MKTKNNIPLWQVLFPWAVTAIIIAFFIWAAQADTPPLGTNEYWIVTYMKGAKPDGVKTNLAHKIEGVPQTNPTEEDARIIRDFSKTARKAKHKDEQTWKNMVKDIKKARDKFIEQEFIDLANKLLAILDQVPNN